MFFGQFCEILPNSFILSLFLLIASSVLTVKKALLSKFYTRIARYNNLVLRRGNVDSKLSKFHKLQLNKVDKDTLLTNTTSHYNLR